MTKHLFESEDPHDDSTHWVCNLPETHSDRSERIAERDLGRPKQSDIQCKELPLEQRGEA